MATFWRGCETTKQQACGREIRHTACDLGYQHKTWMSFFLKKMREFWDQKRSAIWVSAFQELIPLRFSRTFVDNSPCLWVKNGENQTPPMDPMEAGDIWLRLEQLTNMGFPDRPSNIQALQMANGDVNQVPISPISSRVWGRWEEMEGTKIWCKETLGDGWTNCQWLDSASVLTFGDCQVKLNHLETIYCCQRIALETSCLARFQNGRPWWKAISLHLSNKQSAAKANNQDLNE